MRRWLSLFLVVAFSVISVHGQGDDRTARSRILQYFSTYSCDLDLRSISVLKTEIDHKEKKIRITLSDNFSRQLFRTDGIRELDKSVREVLPSSLAKYSIELYSNNREISELVPNRLREFTDQTLLWNSIRHRDMPWKKNESSPYDVRRGLSGVHLSVTPSHGYYFDNQEKNIWKWQRPPLWCTREDLLTQSFVYPYLIPMLENAGATVTSMRERDWQTQCTIVDNKSGRKYYQEHSSRNRRWQSETGGGYSVAAGRLLHEGSATVRIVGTGSGKSSEFATAEWIPDIPADGQYAVYVTYRSFSNSSQNATYTVWHEGGQTTFKVNQQIGGGTWLYLGTFTFRKGQSETGMVTLDNNSDSGGIVCADAVRFGGGSGDEERGNGISGKARYLEGARYYARFSGAPDSVFLKYDGTNDYNEDIQTRPRMTNWLSGGSVFNPQEEGIGVPIELSLALHTDAGVRLGDSIVGSLGICTTQMKDGILGTGLSRSVSRDLTDQILTEIRKDISAAIGRDWSIRGIQDDNYCESREPQVPSALLELLSHQNFYDLKYAFDPKFRFTASRAIYKAILKYVSFMHGRQYTVQPLPVSHFMIEEDREAGSLKLSWQPEPDPLEPSARPDGYIVYTSIDGLAFDNGLAVRHPFYEILPEPGHVYSFRITAVNSGGQSMPSETLSAGIARKSKGTILIVNGFQRLSGPTAIETESRLGFDLEHDEGVQYMSSPVYCGYQKVFDRSHARMTDEEELGYSGDELDGVILKGNTFDYPYIHGTAIAAGREYSFVSCSREALEDSLVSLTGYPVTDIILGLQKHTPNDTIMGTDYSTFPTGLMQMVTDYYTAGGKLLVSGSYIGSDLCTTSEGAAFAKDILRFNWNGTIHDSGEKSVNGLNGRMELTVGQDGEIYRLSHPDIIEPTDSSIAIFAYSNSRYCGGVAHRDGERGVIAMGFPFESIKGGRQRAKVMSSLIEYLSK